MSGDSQEVFAGNLTCLTKRALPRKLTCGLIHSRDDFIRFGQMDNFEAVTIKLKPTLWSDDLNFRRRLYDYMRNRNMNYYLVPETGSGGLNLHYHGLIGFGYSKHRRCFVSWLNKNFGKFYASGKTDINRWYNYVHKGTDDELVPYLFDDGYEPVLEGIVTM